MFNHSPSLTDFISWNLNPGFNLCCQEEPGYCILLGLLSHWCLAHSLPAAIWCFALRIASYYLFLWGYQNIGSDSGDSEGEALTSCFVVFFLPSLTCFPLNSFIYMCVAVCLHVCLCTMCLPGAQGGQERASGRPGEGLRSDLLLTGVTASCELPCECWESNSGSSEEQPVFLNFELSPAPTSWSLNASIRSYLCLLPGHFLQDMKSFYVPKLLLFHRW